MSYGKSKSSRRSLKSEFKVKIQVLFSVDWLTQSGNFENLLESNRILLPKENLILMDRSTNVQIYKNYRGQKVFISMVQTELISSVYTLENFPWFSLTFIPLWNSISSLILRVSVCMAPRSWSNLWRSPWGTSCPKWSFHGFTLRISISLSDHNSFKLDFLESLD
jgi:hypothetical protein